MVERERSRAYTENMHQTPPPLNFVTLVNIGITTTITLYVDLCTTRIASRAAFLAPIRNVYWACVCWDEITRL